MSFLAILNLFMTRNKKSQYILSNGFEKSNLSKIESCLERFAQLIISWVNMLFRMHFRDRKGI
jgi:hypothetical protein